VRKKELHAETRNKWQNGRKWNYLQWEID